jgi:carbonic anhydrase
MVRSRIVFLAAVTIVLAFAAARSTCAADDAGWKSLDGPLTKVDHDAKTISVKVGRGQAPVIDTVVDVDDETGITVDGVKTAFKDLEAGGQAEVTLSEGAHDIRVKGKRVAAKVTVTTK